MPEDEDRAQAQHWQTHRRLVAGRYLLVRELGRGGMGVVWLAADEFLGRQVAVKELRPPRGLADQDLDVHQRRALREARSAARIRHPGAVTLYEAIPAGGGDDAVYLIMELIDGPTLAQLVARDGPLPAARVAALGAQLLDVLQAAHALGIVHRDVKPGNILITAGGQPKLADFGIAHTLGDPRLTTSGVMGTQAYQAPELFESAPVTPAADLWSLGATLYYAADGHGPFDRDSTGATLRAIILDDLPVPRTDPHLAAAITALLHRDPATRATTDQARAELHLVPGQGSSPPADPGQRGAITTRPSGASSSGRERGWNPDDETRRRLDAPPVPDLPSEAPGKRAPGRGYLSRRAIVIATVAAAAVGGAFAVLAAVGGPGTPGIQPVHPTITSGSPKPGPTRATVVASSPLSEDTAGQMVAFVNGSGQIMDDYDVSGWRGPRALPGTPRVGSPIVVSPDGSRVFFIEPNGDVVDDYASGSGWAGPGRVGGTAEAGSTLAFYPGNGAGTRPVVAFIGASGRLVYDYYASGWHGPGVLPGTPQACRSRSALMRPTSSSSSPTATSSTTTPPDPAGQAPTRSAASQKPALAWPSHPVAARPTLAQPLFSWTPAAGSSTTTTPRAGMARACCRAPRGPAHRSPGAGMVRRPTSSSPTARSPPTTSPVRAGKAPTAPAAPPPGAQPLPTPPATAPRQAGPT